MMISGIIISGIVFVVAALIVAIIVVVVGITGNKNDLAPSTLHP